MAKAPDEIDIHIGARVKVRRMMLGMSQEQLGNALGLTFQQVQKYERGLNRIGAGRLWHIAQALETPVDFFFEGLPETEGDEDEADLRLGRITSFLSSPDGLQLGEAFARIEDSATRRRLVDLVRTISGNDTVRLAPVARVGGRGGEVHSL